MIYVISIVIGGILASFPVRFWLSVRRLGKLDATLRMDAHMFALDVASIWLAVMPIYWAMHAWYGFTVPGLDAKLGWQGSMMAVLCVAGSLGGMLVNGRQRFEDGARAGMPEAALRWLATRQIISAAEVANILAVWRSR